MSNYPVGLSSIFSTAARAGVVAATNDYRVVHVADGEHEDGNEYVSAPKSLDDAVEKRDQMQGTDSNLKVWVEDANGNRVEI
jgi:hypothetical protein